MRASVLIAAVVCVLQTLMAQEPFVSLEGVDLHVGMSKADVFAILAQRYDLTRVGQENNDMWCLLKSALANPH